MRNQSPLPSELSFLSWLEADRNFDYRMAEWLKTDFSSEVWIGQLDSYEFTIDFRVTLEDGSLLTATKNAVLLDTLKSWLCVQTHQDATGGIVYSPLVAFHHISRTLRLIDYFLVNTDYFKLAKHGLNCINASDLKRLITDLSASDTTAESIYRWSEKVSKYLQEAANKLPSDELELIKTSCPAISQMHDDKIDRTLDLTDEELVRARAYLWSQNAYSRSQLSNFRCALRPSFLAREIYKNTLWGKTTKSSVEELNFDPIERYGREYPYASVRTSRENMMLRPTLNLWRTSLRSIGLLTELGLPVPMSALDSISGNGFLESLTLKPLGRFQTLPQQLVFSCLRNAVEFALEFGRDLIESYIAIVTEAHSRGQKLSVFAFQNDIRPFLTDKIRLMGVKAWHLSDQMSFIEANPKTNVNGRAPATEFFRRFRNNDSLYELLIVLYGAVQIGVGILMARRQGELLDLIAGSALDKTKRYMIFSNRKSGFQTMRERIARPIPEIAARMISLIENLQVQLVKLGCMNELTSLFCPPNSNNLGLNNVLTSPTPCARLLVVCLS